jgi:hypothetical protein
MFSIVFNPKALFRLLREQSRRSLAHVAGRFVPKPTQPSVQFSPSPMTQVFSGLSVLRRGLAGPQGWRRAAITVLGKYRNEGPVSCGAEIKKSAASRRSLFGKIGLQLQANRVPNTSQAARRTGANCRTNFRIRVPAGLYSCSGSP